MGQGKSHSKALFLVPRYWPSIGGAQLHTRQLAQRLRRTGPIGVVGHCGDDSDNAELSFARTPTLQREDGGVRIHQIGGDSGWTLPLALTAKVYPRMRAVRPLYSRLFNIASRPALQKVARNYDLIHAVYNGLTASAELAADVCHQLDMPFVWTPLAHTTLPQGSGWSSPRFRRLYQRADALIAMTEYEREWLVANGANADRVHVCPVGGLLASSADGYGFRADHQLRDEPLVLFLGRLVESKGYKTLTLAAQRVWTEFPKARFVFLGPLTDEARAWFKNNHDPRLMTPGLLSDTEKTAALSACDLLCVPSTEESLGVTYLEAWSLGKPVVAADIPVLRTVIDHEQDGLLTLPEPVAVATAICRLLADSGLRRQLGANGARKVQHQYSWDTITRRMAHIHRTAVAMS